jgi:hypothetical protein
MRDSHERLLKILSNELPGKKRVQAQGYPVPMVCSK